MYMYVYHMAESLCCPSETITTLLMGWVCVSAQFVSDFLQPRGLRPARFLCPWNSPGRNTSPGPCPHPGIEPRTPAHLKLSQHC